MLEILYIPKMNKEFLDSLVSFEERKYFFDTLSRNNGLFFISGHISNWEIIALFSVVLSRKFNVVVKQQTNNLVDKKINAYRERLGNEMIEIGASLRNLYSKIKQKEIICFLMDQSANPDYSIYADFFGHKTATFAGPAKMALRFRPDMIFAYLIRDKKYRYKIILEKIDYDDLKESDDKNEEILTERINEKLETVIREYPEQWLWFHKRFKHIKK